MSAKMYKPSDGTYFHRYMPLYMLVTYLRAEWTMT